MTFSDSKWGIHWFRRDLRVPGNEALRENWKRTGGRTLGIFCFDSQFLSRPDFSHNRFAFFIKTLRALKEDLLRQGGDLLVVDCQPQIAFPKLLNFCSSQNIRTPDLITWNRDYEPFARQRDEKIEILLKSLGCEVKHTRDHLLFEPHEITKSESSDAFYQVYSPYARRWFDKLNSTEASARLKTNENLKSYFNKSASQENLFKIRWTTLTQNKFFPFKDSLDEFEFENNKSVSIDIPPAGAAVAFNKLMEFKDLLENYKDHRDFPALKATSRLSIYLKNGSLTVPQIIANLNLSNAQWKEKSGSTHFVKELVWREFYYSILFHRPEVEHQSFLPQYENISWENNLEFFEKWKDGKTGYPIVDAGMRELAQTGWMHNRVRMIVASFLTKDLLIDWRLGENHFMKLLLDGDLALNNGGWQWAASTGCDPQPYFRIFNPWLQGAKFDPQGTYIKTFVKELEKVPVQDIHEPDGARYHWGYPRPIVDHSIQRDKALSLYKKV